MVDGKRPVLRVKLYFVESEMIFMLSSRLSGLVADLAPSDVSLTAQLNVEEKPEWSLHRNVRAFCVPIFEADRVCGCKPEDQGSKEGATSLVTVR